MTSIPGLSEGCRVDKVRVETALGSGDLERIEDIKALLDGIRALSPEMRLKVIPELQERLSQIIPGGSASNYLNIEQIEFNPSAFGVVIEAGSISFPLRPGMMVEPKDGTVELPADAKLWRVGDSLILAEDVAVNLDCRFTDETGYSFGCDGVPVVVKAGALVSVHSEVNYLERAA